MHYLKMIVFKSDGERRIGAKERGNQIIPGIRELPRREAEVGSCFQFFSLGL